MVRACQIPIDWEEVDVKPVRDPKTGLMVLPERLYTSMNSTRVGLKGALMQTFGCTPHA